MKALLIGLLWAQDNTTSFWGKLNPYGGISFQAVDIAFAGQPLFSNPPPYTGLLVGAHYSYTSSKDERFSFGPASHVCLSLQLSGGLRTQYLIQVPAVLEVRYGARATRFNEQHVGIALAGGLNFVNFQLLYLTASGITGRINEVLLSPVVSAEVIVNPTRSSATGIRFHVTPLRVRRNTKLVDSIDPIPLDYLNWAFTILYYFGG
ncbi:MAG: hypothetical protein ACUVRD_03230 [Bacteroidia bacterium]